MKRTGVLTAFAIGIALVALPALSGAVDEAQIFLRVPFGSTPNPVGSGGRAIAWGGAFMAVADDATAANWNPGGLTQLVTPETSVALSYHTRMEQADFQGFSSDTESRVSSTANLNYASLVYPFNIGGVNMVASINYQRLYEFDRDMEYSASGTDQTGREFIQTRTLEQSGALTTLTPAFCVQITPYWSLGAAVNFWGVDDAGDGWEQVWQVEGIQDPDSVGRVETFGEFRQDWEFSGMNYVIGTHVKIQNLTLGAVYKTSFEADIDFDSHYEFANFFPNHPAQSSITVNEYNLDNKLVWPASYGLGAAYRYSDSLSFAIDAFMTEWSEYVLKTNTRDLNLLAGDDQTADIEDTYQVRAGMEYLFIRPKYVFALRGGGFWDPEQVQDEVNDFYGAAFGAGIAYQNLVVDCALQFKWAEGVKTERVGGVQAEADVQDWFGIVSLVYHF